MTRHIGIVARSAEGAALCYRTICTEGADEGGGLRRRRAGLHGNSFVHERRELAVPTLDSTRLLTRKALRLALDGALSAIPGAAIL